MSDAKLTFTSDIKQLERDNAKLVKDNAKITESLRKAKEEAGNFSNAWTAGVKRIQKEQEAAQAGTQRWRAGLAGLAAETRRVATEAIAAEKAIRFENRLRDNFDAAVRLSQGMKMVSKSANEAVRPFQNLKQEGEQAGVAMVGKLGGAVLGLLAVKSAVDTVRAGYSQWIDTIELTGVKHGAFTQQLVSQLTKTGDATKADQIESRLSGIKGATREQGLAAFAGVSEAEPTMPLEQRLKLAEVVGRAAPTGRDLGQFGGIAAAIQGIAPGKSPEAVASIATKFEQQTGGSSRVGGDKFIRSLKSLVQAGVMPEEALGMGAAALDTNVAPEVLTKVATVIGEPQQEIKKSKTKRVLSPEDMAKNRFAKASDAEQLRLLRSDPSVAQAVLGDEAAFQFQRLMPAVPQRTAELLSAPGIDTFQESIDVLGKSRAGRASRFKADIATRTEESEIVTGPQQDRLGDLRKLIRARAAAQGPIQGMRAEGLIGIERFGDPLLGSSAQSVFGGSTTQEGRLIQSAERAGIIDPKEASELAAALRENTRAVQGANRQRGAVNVDRHVD